MKLSCRGLHKNLLDPALAPPSTELQLEMGRQLREKPLMQKDDFKRTLGKKTQVNTSDKRFTMANLREKKKMKGVLIRFLKQVSLPAAKIALLVVP